MKKNIIIYGIIVLFFFASTPLLLGAEASSKDTDEKTTVCIQGVSYQYKFGSFVHLGRIWWCPHYTIKLVFDVDDSFVFYINGEKQIISSEKVSISMDGFFGIAPTLYSYLTADTVRVFGVCDTLSIKEW